MAGRLHLLIEFSRENCLSDLSFVVVVIAVVFICLFFFVIFGGLLLFCLFVLAQCISLLHFPQAETKQMDTKTDWYQLTFVSLFVYMVHINRYERRINYSLSRDEIPFSCCYQESWNSPWGLRYQLVWCNLLTMLISSQISKPKMFSSSLYTTFVQGPCGMGIALSVSSRHILLLDH